MLVQRHAGSWTLFKRKIQVCLPFLRSELPLRGVCWVTITQPEVAKGFALYYIYANIHRSAVIRDMPRSPLGGAAGQFEKIKDVIARAVSRAEIALQGAQEEWRNLR